MINSSRSSGEIRNRFWKKAIRSEIKDKLKVQSRRINEIIENFIILLPLLIMTAGIIIMYILNKIFLK